MKLKIQVGEQYNQVVKEFTTKVSDIGLNISNVFIIERTLYGFDCCGELGEPQLSKKYSPAL